MLFGAQSVQNRVCANARECCDLFVLLNEQIESLAYSNPKPVPRLVLIYSFFLGFVTIESLKRFNYV